jgi:hypothetical protein
MNQQPQTQTLQQYHLTAKTAKTEINKSINTPFGMLRRDYLGHKATSARLAKTPDNNPTVNGRRLYNITLTKTITCEKCSTETTQPTTINGLTLCQKCATPTGKKCSKKHVPYETYLASSAKCGACTGPCKWEA